MRKLETTQCAVHQPSSVPPTYKYACGTAVSLRGPTPAARIDVFIYSPTDVVTLQAASSPLADGARVFWEPVDRFALAGVRRRGEPDVTKHRAGRHSCALCVRDRSLTRVRVCFGVVAAPGQDTSPPRGIPQGTSGRHGACRRVGAALPSRGTPGGGLSDALQPDSEWRRPPAEPINRALAWMVPVSPVLEAGFWFARSGSVLLAAATNGGDYRTQNGVYLQG